MIQDIKNAIPLCNAGIQTETQLGRVVQGHIAID